MRAWSIYSNTGAKPSTLKDKKQTSDQKNSEIIDLANERIDTFYK